MIALEIFGDRLIVQPPVVVADEFVPLGKIPAHDDRIALDRARDGEKRDLRVEPAEDLQKPPRADARAVFERGLDHRAAQPGKLRKTDIVEHALRAGVPVHQRTFAAPLEIEVDVEGDAGAARPLRVRQRVGVADIVAIVLHRWCSQAAGCSSDLASMQCTPLWWLTVCVMRRSPAMLSSA
jgi:hypothetical protein